MFSKKVHLDVKKSTLKIQDAKKDLGTRLKHLKIILENVDITEAKDLFQSNFSHVYQILYESFIQAEANLRQRELSFHLVHKAHKEELDSALWILEQVLALLPELLHKRWQLHSMGRILSKLLHPGNSFRLRKPAMKYFLMWYQALDDNSPEYVHEMFAGLVPGFSPKGTALMKASGSIFHDTNAQHPVTAIEMLPLIPPSAGEKNPDQPSKVYLEILLESMVSTVVRLEWQDKTVKHHRCFQFLLHRFKLYYLPKICPSFCHETSLYKLNLELPVIRKPEADGDFVACRVSLIRWVCSFMQQTKKLNGGGMDSVTGSTTGVPTGNIGGGGGMQSVASSVGSGNGDDDVQHDSSHPSLDSTISLTTQRASDEDLAVTIVKDVLCASRENVNFIHEIYRQAFLLNFGHSIAIRKTIAVYKDLIQLNMSDLPQYIMEPPEDGAFMRSSDNIEYQEGIRTPGRLRNDSYLGAIHKENLFVRAGLQNVLQIFMTHASNVFFLEVNPHFPTILEEQTDACKRILNIYRYMVMQTRMDNNTWEQLLLVLLQITSLVLTENPPKKKAHTLGGKLAPAIFQTLIVTWIKANLNVVISRELWDRFLNVLTSLTSWEELVKEWAKTLETLTRVLARHVYNLDLTDLPLDRLSEQKSKKTRRGISRVESNIPSSGVDSSAPLVTRQDSTCPENQPVVKRNRHGLTRSLSETSLAVQRRRSSQRKSHLKLQQIPRRSHSLDTLTALASGHNHHQHSQHPNDTESTDRSRSPSPAPSSGLESTSIKDSPIQLDVMNLDPSLHSGGGGESSSIVGGETQRGVVCGGTVRGWLPDVAVVLWRRMLGALGDVNQITDPQLHAQVFDYLIHLTDTLIKIRMNQGVSCDNQSTPQSPELIPPVTLILPWCFGALSLPAAYDSGKLSALRLLCTITLNCDLQRQDYLPHFYRALHNALTGSNRPALNITLRYLGPRFLSLQLPGYTLLLLDLIHACNSVLSSNDISPGSPRTEAVSILADLLSLQSDMSNLSVLQPEPGFNVTKCPDIKEHVINILLKAGRREPTGMARCIALSALGMFVYRECAKQSNSQDPRQPGVDSNRGSNSFHPKVKDAVNVLLLALKFNNKMIAQLASNTLYLLRDHASLLWAQSPRLAGQVVRTLCGALAHFVPLPSTTGERDRSLGTALLLCLGEWCMKLEPNRLLHSEEWGENNQGQNLLLIVFKVLYQLIMNKNTPEPSGLTQPSVQDDFDPNILLDNLQRQSPSSTPTKNHQFYQAITLCARTILAHLVTHLGHFPMAIGAPRLSSLVVEHDDVPNLTSDELSATIFTAPNIQLFTLTRNVIASLIELPVLELPGGSVTAGLATADKQVRMLLRDLSGKASWDASILYRTPVSSRSGNGNDGDDSSKRGAAFTAGEYGRVNAIAADKWSQPESLMVGNIQPHRAMRHRQPSQLPDVNNAAPDLDQLDDLLQYLGHTSPECLESFDSKLNEPAHPPISQDVEQEAILSVIGQRNSETEYGRASQGHDAMLGPVASRPDSRLSNSSSSTAEKSTIKYSHGGPVEQTAFQQCRILFSQLGLAGWERRKQLHLLNKTERLLRELRNIDMQSCRETHKVAVVYVAPGQEDKNSILSNAGGSVAYEEFLASLAWEVELEGHTGFLGGLQRQGSTGSTAPYFATSLLEAIFHVATRMPGDSPEAMLNKTRHLGNDEVHIVWSEHNRDYRRDIIPTEFCDVLITIYPLGNRLNRVTVKCKPEVPYFGVLFDEAIVESNILAGLVRATAICASRAKRSILPFYQQYYEERSRALDTVLTKHKDATTYEEFIARVYSPVVTTCTSTASNPASSDSLDSGSATSQLTAALLDHSHSNFLRFGHGRTHHHEGGSGNHRYQHQRSSESSGKGVWFNNPEMVQSVESTSISPRPLKKLKSVPRRSLRQEAVATDSPPDSPTQAVRRK